MWECGSWKACSEAERQRSEKKQEVALEDEIHFLALSEGLKSFA